MTDSAAPTTTLRKAAIVLTTLGEDLAARVCCDLPAEQTRLLQQELATLDQVPPEEHNAVLDEFLALAWADRNKPATRTPDPAAEDLRFLTRLNDLEPVVLWRALREERLQTVAAVLSHLTPSRAGQLLAHYDQDIAADIAYRAAHLGSPSPGALEALGGALSRELGGIQGRGASSPEISLQFVVDLIGSMPTDRGKLVLRALQARDPEFGDGVAEQVFTFEDVSKLGDDDLQRVLRTLDMSILVVALKGTPPELKERFRQNLSQRGRERLEEEMDMLGRVPLSQVQEAQKQVCQEIRNLAETGDIRLDSAGTQYVE
ncbi:MAG: FliG C-terminal domain-containing protein [Armatimonadia bacterium]